MLLGEGALDPQTKQWQKHLLCWVAEEFQSLKALVGTLWRDYPDGFYTHPGNNDKGPKKVTKG